MELETREHSQLLAAFRTALSRPPTATGTRLRSERELAATLKVGRKLIRVVLEHLVDEGVLVRRHGSGTYVRRVPDRTVDDLIHDSNGRSSSDNVPTDAIIVAASDDAADEEPLSLARHQRRLRLEVWSGFHKTTVTNRAILNAMLDRADQAGHDLSVHSLVRQAELPISEAELAQRLRAQPGDGYLVSGSLGQLFRRAFNTAFGSTQPSAVYVSPGSAQVECEPLIRIDTDEAVMRAVRLLRSEGYRRVGMVAASNALRSGPTETSIYNWAAEAAGQVYRGVVEVPRDTDGGYAGALALLARDELPDALYVANDELLPGVVEALRTRGYRPGHDTGLITLSTTTQPLPPNLRWSQLQFDPVLVGQDAVDAILKLVQTAGRRVASQSYMAKWVPGDTHRRP